MKSVLFAAAASAALATATPAFAGDADATVDEVIVTARAGIEAQKKIEASYAITVVGDAGIGKSRLLDEFSAWRHGQPARVLELHGHTTPQTEGQIFGLLRDILARHLCIADDDPRVNRYGGAIACGHPLASSGVRLMIQLARQFAEDPSVRYGITSMCIGMGMGATVIWENPHHADYVPGATSTTQTKEAAAR